MNMYLRLHRTKPYRRPEAPETRSVIAGTEEVSAPGAELRVVKVNLTPEGRRLLQCNARSIG